ncbi:FAD-dependent oxidoreductase [Rhizorhabdus dicambivorans]|uniref:FAD-dependent oxidoreductase n=2 Tax=Rhizorhabdus dicambivorans TaxID=1850238 RepID=A0A2A4FRR3_9SPHN|nr:FAD-dependent oxidoreductase [Rhizorhabdus dicambivorans]PCE41103.1 FAD-dependent oxidoreductase [Rhizorhabdus dicambivorans]
MIVGAGFSGTLQAINLLRHEGPHATLIERQPHAGRGIAYSAAHPDHLLNVRAGNMSALPDDPDHFLRWLARHRPELGGFVPRIVYGDYLADLLRAAMERAEGRLTLIRGEAVDAERSGGGYAVTLDDGRRLAADTLVLAPGNLPPHEPPALAGAGLDPDLYAPDPWSGNVADGLAADDRVLIVGTGLTMVDVALLLDARGFRGRIIAMSRRGLLPHAHADQTMGAPLQQRPPLRPSELLRSVRARTGATGWRPAVDALRPFTQDLWLGADAEGRRRFLRHLRPWWDIHRHRLAPRVAERIAAMRADGRLDIVAGKLAGADVRDGQVDISWRPRGADTLRTLRVRRIVNASGPQGDLARTGEPLLRRLLERGLIRPDALHLGIDVNPQSEAIGASGQADSGLLVIGPMTRGTFWEIVAVPDIRVQTWSVARRLSNAHWVEGEGL